MSDNKTLVLIRGLPWTGKSYTAKAILNESPESGVILSTDDYFYTVNKPDQPDEYSFDPSLLGKAHEWNQNRVAHEINQGTTLIIVDNTNTLPWECQPYAKLAHEAGYEIKIQEPTSERWLEIRSLLAQKDRKKVKDQLKSWSEMLAEGSKESHNVPAFAIEKMMARWHNDITVKEALEAKR